MNSTQKNCGNCGRTNPSRNSFCSGCGLPLRKPERQRTREPHLHSVACLDPVCPQCGLAHAPRTDACMVCGLPLCEDMHIDVFDDYAVITVKTRTLDYENNRRLSRAFKALKTPRVVVDMSAVHSIDSIAVGTLVTHTLHWPKFHTEIKIVGLQGPVMRMVQIMKVDNVLDIDDGLETCLQNWRAAC